MGLFGFVIKSVLGSRLRGAMTLGAVCVTLVAFVLLRAVSAAWTEQVEQTPNNRVVTRHKLGWAKNLPARYAQTIRELDGVKNAVGVRWMGLRVRSSPGTFFESLAVEPGPFVDIHYEVDAPADQKRAFLNDRRGALVSEELAKEFGWKLGDRVPFAGMFDGIFQQEFELTISAIFRSTRYGFARRVIWCHLDYYNESLIPAQRDRISLVSAEIHDPNQGARLAKAVDIHFDDADDRTFSQEDKALNAANGGRFGAILDAVSFVSFLVLAVVGLILGNTIAMNARERAQQYAVLRAIGFRPRHVAALVLGEALVLGVAGALLAVLLAHPLVERAMSRYFEESMSLPPLELSLGLALGCVGLAAVLALGAGLLPALGLSRANVVSALRRVD